MTENHQSPDTTQTVSVASEAPADFSWDSLPELAKERWEQAVAYSSTIENQLTKSKASRAQAEIGRQRIAKEILAATKEACHEVVAEAKRALDKIKNKIEESEAKREDAKRQLQEAKTVRIEADAYREAVHARADQQAEDVLQRARASAETECARLINQVSFEAQRLLAQSEAIRAAAKEELEAQRIYTEAAMLKADAHEALDQLKALLEAPEAFSYEDNGDGQDVAAEQSQLWGIAKSWEQEPANGAKSTQPKSTESPATESTAEPVDSVGSALEDEPVIVPGDDGTGEPAPVSPPSVVSKQESPRDSSESGHPNKTQARDRRSKAT